MIGRLNNFDLIRLFAACEVAIVHGMIAMGYHSDALEVALHVFPGVPIFFLISGYLIFRSYENSRDLKIFFINRALRIYPALYVCFAVSIAAVVVTGYLAPSSLLTPGFAFWTAAQLTVGQFYNPEFMRGFGDGVLNGSLWTITVELQFYLLTPIAFWVLSRWPRLWIPAILLFAAANVISVVVFDAFDDTSTLAKLTMVSFVPWFYMFLVGAWLSTVRSDLVERIVSLPLTALLAIYLIAALAGYFAGLDVGTNTINPVMFLALGAIVIKLAYTAPATSERLLRRNDISYGIYIYHLPVINVLMYFGLVGSGVWFGTAMAVTVVLALLSWMLVERPAMSLKPRTIRSVTSVEAQESGAGDVSLGTR